MMKTISGKTSGPARHRVIPPTSSPPETVRGRSRGGMVENPESNIENAADVSVRESLRQRIDPELRYRMISERAFEFYVARGYADGNDMDDWLEAEKQVESMLA